MPRERCKHYSLLSVFHFIKFLDVDLKIMSHEKRIYLVFDSFSCVHIYKTSVPQIGFI